MGLGRGEPGPLDSLPRWRTGWMREKKKKKVLFAFEGFRCIQSSARSRHPVAPAGGQSDAPHGQARPARVFPALGPVMDPLHLPVARQPHLPLLSQEEQQRIHHDVRHEQVQNGESSRYCVALIFSLKKKTKKKQTAEAYSQTSKAFCFSHLTTRL